MLIEARDVSVSIDGRTIIDRVDLSCPPGTMTAIVGPSGSGKTTLLHCLGLLQVPTAGQVLADGSDTTGWSSSRRRRFWSDHSAFVLQDYGVMDEETVAFNVTMAARRFGLGRKPDAARLQEILRRTGLSGRDGEPAARLSGGEKQRMSIARALYKDASVVLVDEPTASLDSANRARVVDLFTELAHQGRVVIIASHDDEMIDACTGRFSVVPRTNASPEPGAGALTPNRASAQDGARDGVAQVDSAVAPAAGTDHHGADSSRPVLTSAPHNEGQQR